MSARVCSSLLSRNIPSRRKFKKKFLHTRNTQQTPFGKLSPETILVGEIVWTVPEQMQNDVDPRPNWCKSFGFVDCFLSVLVTKLTNRPLYPFIFLQGWLIYVFKLRCIDFHSWTETRCELCFRKWKQFLFRLLLMGLPSFRDDHIYWESLLIHWNMTNGSQLLC